VLLSSSIICGLIHNTTPWWYHPFLLIGVVSSIGNHGDS